jgi:hypothetical protein
LPDGQQGTVRLQIVADPDALRRLAEVLIRLEAKSDGWNQLYVDQATGDRWEERRLHSEAHGGGLAYLLRLPDPAPAELVALAVGSPHRDEAVVALVYWASIPRIGENNT